MCSNAAEPYNCAFHIDHLCCSFRRGLYKAAEIRETEQISLPVGNEKKTIERVSTQCTLLIQCRRSELHSALSSIADVSIMNASVDDLCDRTKTVVFVLRVGGQSVPGHRMRHACL